MVPSLAPSLAPSLVVIHIKLILFLWHCDYFVDTYSCFLTYWLYHHHKMPALLTTLYQNPNHITPYNTALHHTTSHHIKAHHTAQHHTKLYSFPVIIHHTPAMPQALATLMRSIICLLTSNHVIGIATITESRLKTHLIKSHLITLMVNSPCICMSWQLVNKAFSYLLQNLKKYIIKSSPPTFLGVPPSSGQAGSPRQQFICDRR